MHLEHVLYLKEKFDDVMYKYTGSEHVYMVNGKVVMCITKNGNDDFISIFFDNRKDHVMIASDGENTIIYPINIDHTNIIDIVDTINKYFFNDQTIYCKTDQETLNLATCYLKSIGAENLKLKINESR